MPQYRLATILASKDVSTAGTETIDINIQKPISRIVIEYKGTNNGATPTAHGAKMVSKIELVDGSDVLYSCSGIESQAVTYYGTGRLPFMVNEYRNDVMNIQTFELNFGRWLYDPELALLPTKFKNLQLKITHNKANGGSSPDAGNLRVFADVFDEKAVSPRGFLMTKEFYTYSLTSSAHEFIDLPTDYPYRLLIVQSLAAGKQPWEQYNKIKLSINNDEAVPINNESTSDLLKLWRPTEPIVEEICGTGTGSAVTHYVTFTFETYVTLLGFDAATTTNYCNQSYGGTAAIAFDSAEHFQGHVTGLAPHGALALQLWDKDDIGGFFQAQRYGSIRLDITAGSSVGSNSTCEIVIQQLRTY